MTHSTDDPHPDRVGLTADGESDTTTTRSSGNATGVFTPYRRVVARPDTAGGGQFEVPFDGLDVDISVIHSGTGAAEWHVDAHGVTDDLWEVLSEGTDLSITLGWMNGPTREVACGPIRMMRPGSRRDDRRFTFRGVSAEAARLGKRVSRTWTDATPHGIARDMARIANLSVGNIARDADALPGNWTITNTRPVSYWFDKLVTDTEENTGRAWTWYARNDALFFVPKGTPTGSQVTFANKESFDQFPARHGANSPHTPEPKQHERSFERKLEPEVRRGRRVGVTPPGGSDEEGTTHVVGSHQFESSSRTGRHYVHGTLIPSRADYRTRPVKRSYINPSVAPEEPEF